MILAPGGVQGLMGTISERGKGARKDRDEVAESGFGAGRPLCRKRRLQAQLGGFEAHFGALGARF